MARFAVFGKEEKFFARDGTTTQIVELRLTNRFHNESGPARMSYLLVPF